MPSGWSPEQPLIRLHDVYKTFGAATVAGFEAN